MTEPRRNLARPLLALGAVSLVIGVWAGLARVGAVAWVPRAQWVGLHGPLLASGFFGTVICAERAVAARARVALLAPLVSGAGALSAIAGAPPAIAAACAALSAAALVAIVARAMVRAPSLDLAVSAAGALAWGAGAVAWLAGRPIPDAAPSWVAFLALTVGAERLELTRVVPRPAWAKVAFAIASAAVLGAALGCLAPAARPLASRALGAGLFALGAWLAAWDVARKTIGRAGLPRFAAACILAGAAWLLVAGAIAATRGLEGAAYDAVLHAVFLGFAFSMVFGHAPTVLAAVARVEVAYRARFWAHFALLHASVVARVASDLAAPLAPLRPWSGVLTACALVVFVASTLGSRVRHAASS